MALFTHPRRISAFSLVELLVTMTLIGIVAALAAPSFRTLAISQRIKTAGFDLTSSMSLARSEAIKQNGDVTVSPVSGSWTNGWVISGAGGTIKKQSSYSSVTIAGPTSVVYNRSGRLTTTASVNFSISDATSGSTIQGRCVTLGLTGQPSTKTGSC